MRDKREMLKEILESAVPITFQDVVVTFCTVTGWRRNNLVQISDARKIYAAEWDGEVWSAIQITTAAGVCAVLDLHAAGTLLGTGFVKQEDVSLDAFLDNRFGQYFRSKITTRFPLPNDIREME
jgi:saccharopine dehydrogenase-like NADP-dependent oxidoreductase